MTDAELIAAVAQMRGYQREYFRTRNAGHLAAAKEMESRVDEELRRRADAGRPKPKTLFEMIDEFDEPPTERQLT